MWPVQLAIAQFMRFVADTTLHCDVELLLTATER
jgi:hypothetical protein